MQSLNRAVKAIAVARKYIKDEDPSYELAFQPLNRSDSNGVVQPNLFAFLVFKTVVANSLKDFDETDLNVSKNSDPNAMVRWTWTLKHKHSSNMEYSCSCTCAHLLTSQPPAQPPAPACCLHTWPKPAFSAPSPAHDMKANAIICIIKERKQAVMKAGGNEAIFVAMSAVVNARRRLKRNFNCDIFLVGHFVVVGVVSY